MILFIPLFFYFSKVFACELKHSGHINFTTSTKERIFLAYQNDKTSLIPPFIKVSNCSNLTNANKYLMISFGPQNLDLTDRTRAFDIANRYRDSGCVIEDSPFQFSDNFSARKKYLEEKWHTIKSCYEIVVSYEGEENLRFPQKQPGCSYQVQGKNQFSFSGGFCFFQPGPSSDYKVQIKLKKECLDYEGISNLNVKVTDLQAALNFYAAKEPTGDSLDLTSLASVPVRLTVSPHEDIFPPSEVLSTIGPEFPSWYYLVDTYFGTPEIEQQRPESTRFRIPLWVDNKCPRFCAKNFCQGLCDYAQPIAGVVRLFDISSSVPKESFTEYVQGGIAFPRFQGEISGSAFIVNDDFIKVGRSYRLQMVLSDPKYDFDLLRFQYQKKIERLKTFPAKLGREQIPNVPQIAPINPTLTVPEMVEVQGINFNRDLNAPFWALLETFSGNFRHTQWPPYFAKVCADQGCRSLGKDFLILTQEFTILSFNPETRKYSLQVKKIKRESSLLESFEKIDPKMPRIVCKRPLE
jgi:hypothetical protein